MPIPPRGGKAECQAAANAATSASVGNRPSRFLEKRRLPSTVTSNTPPEERRRVMRASGTDPRMTSRAWRARGS